MMPQLNIDGSLLLNKEEVDIVVLLIDTQIGIFLDTLAVCHSNSEVEHLTGLVKGLEELKKFKASILGE